MTKKRAKEGRKPREKTALDADAVAAKAADLADLAKKLSDIAEKMRVRKIDFIEVLGATNWLQGFEKLRSSTNSIDRAYADRSIAPIRAKVAEKREAGAKNPRSDQT